MVEGTQGQPDEPDGLTGPTADVADELARIIVSHGEKITQLLINNKMVTPLMTIQLHSMLVDCVSEVLSAMEG